MDLFTLPYNPLTDFLRDPDNFLFGFTLEKSESGKDGKRWIQGIASAEVKDSDGESLVQKGMNCQPLLESGSINWDHQDKQGPAYLIGEPTDVEIVSADKYANKFGKSLHGAAMFVRGFLYNDADNKPVAEATWQHLSTADVSPGRQLRWSVQGRVLERDGLDKSRIIKSECRHLALTHQPIQRYTFAEIAKSLGVGTTHDPIALRKADLQQRIHQWRSECHKSCYSQSANISGISGALRHLYQCRGRDLQKSKALLVALHNDGFTF